MTVLTVLSELLKAFQLMIDYLCSLKYGHKYFCP